TMSGIRLPHEALKGIDAQLTDVTREEKDGKVVYSGKLTPDAAQEYSGAKRMKEAMQRFAGAAGGGGGQMPDPTASGTMKIVTAGGAVERLEIDTKMTTGFGDQTRKLTIKLSGWNATTYEVPKDALGKFTN